MPPGPRRPSIPVGTTLDLELDPTAAALQEALGSRVVLIRALDQGGMGQVYLGRDPQLKRFVAVKVLGQTLGPDTEARARFQLEAQAIAAVSHPYVVDIYGIGELPDGTPYFIMEYIAGGNMATRLAASGPLSISVAERVLGEVASALAAAHRRGIVHRDVKPGNVLWDDEAGRIAVSDFGIATLVGTISEDTGDTEEVRITRAGMAVGSPAYMSPEQLLAEQVTPKSDVYALGLLGYELLTARGPFDASSPSALIASHLRDIPRPLRELRPDAPPALEALIARCLAKRPEDRPSADEIARTLLPGTPEPLEWPPPGLERLQGAAWRSSRWPAVGAALLLVPVALLLLPDQPLANVAVGWGTAYAVSTLVGFFVFAVGIAGAWPRVRAIADATTLGYGVLTLAEVVADRRRDTGSLIAGTREYLSLSPRERGRLRVLRVAAALAAIAGALAPLIAVLLTLLVAGGHRWGATALLDVIVVSLLGPVLAQALAILYEERRMRPLRQLRGDVVWTWRSEEPVMPSWYGAFERARSGQILGAGRPIRRGIVHAAAAAAALVATWCALVLLLTSMFSGASRTAGGSQSWAGFSTTLARAVAVRRAEAYRSPIDSSVSPAVAGAAIAHLVRTATTGATSLATDARSGPRWEVPAPIPGLFGPTTANRDWTTDAIMSASHGLTPAQRDYLERVAAYPSRSEFTLAAAAPGIDLAAGRWTRPLSPSMHPYELSVGSSRTVRAAAESHAARVALDVDARRPRDAEQRAREIISVGSAYLDGPTTLDVLIGIRLLHLGIASLEAVFRATGQHERAHDLFDVMLSGETEMVLGRLPVDGPGVRAAMYDDRLPRAIRVQMLPAALFQSCADPNQLLFGMSTDDRRLRRYASDSLVRYESEREAIALLDGMATGIPREGTGAFHVTGFAKAARVVDLVIGGHRFESCASYYMRRGTPPEPPVAGASSGASITTPPLPAP